MDASALHWLEENAGWAWFALALALAGVEILTLDLIFLMLGLGAVAAGVAALLGAGVGLQALVLAAVALAALAGLRPPLLRRIHGSVPASLSYVESLPGRRVTASTALTAAGGLVTVDGESWSARLEEGEPEAPAGREAVVLRVDGAALVVRPVPVIDWGGDSPAGSPGPPLPVRP